MVSVCKVNEKVKSWWYKWESTSDYGTKPPYFGASASESAAWSLSTVIWTHSAIFVTLWAEVFPFECMFWMTWWNSCTWRCTLIYFCNVETLQGCHFPLVSSRWMWMRQLRCDIVSHSSFPSESTYLYSGHYCVSWYESLSDLYAGRASTSKYYRTFCECSEYHLLSSELEPGKKEKRANLHRMQISTSNPSDHSPLGLIVNKLWMWARQ